MADQSKIGVYANRIFKRRAQYFRAEVAALKEEYGIKREHLFVLREIKKATVHPDTIAITSIHRVEGVKDAVNELLEMGIIIPNTQDLGPKYVISEKGEEFFTRSKNVLIDMNNDILSVITTEEKEQLESILERIDARLTEYIKK